MSCYHTTWPISHSLREGSFPPANGVFCSKRRNYILCSSEYQSKLMTAQKCVIIMDSVITVQNTVMLESIYQTYDRAFKLCCLSKHCLIKMCEVMEHSTSCMYITSCFLWEQPFKNSFDWSSDLYNYGNYSCGILKWCDNIIT